jgi:hypothetical protein
MEAKKNQTQLVKNKTVARLKIQKAFLMVKTEFNRCQDEKYCSLEYREQVQSQIDQYKLILENI